MRPAGIPQWDQQVAARVAAAKALESGSQYVIRRRPELSYIPTP